MKFAFYIILILNNGQQLPPEETHYRFDSMYHCALFANGPEANHLMTVIVKEEEGVKMAIPACHVATRLEEDRGA